MADEKPHLNLVVIGHVDHGKSTMTGHMLFLAGAVDKRLIDKYAEESEKIGKPSWKYAWVLQKLQEERERGLTIDVSFFKFETKNTVFTIIDAPGHRDFVKNMITGASQANAAILVVSAEKNDLEAGLATERIEKTPKGDRRIPGGQTVEHLTLAITLGINQIAVAVNKMDLVGFKEEGYKNVVDRVKALIDGFVKSGLVSAERVANIKFVPTSGMTGDGLVSKGDNLSWYKGPTLMEALGEFTAPELPTSKPLRMPIQDVYAIKGVGTVPVGKVEAGVLKPGLEVIFPISKKRAKVQSIEMHHETLPQALPGDNVGFNIKGINRNEIKKGDIVGYPGADEPKLTDTFVARTFILKNLSKPGANQPTGMSVGYAPIIHLGQAAQACQIVSFNVLKKSAQRKSLVATGEYNPETYLLQGDFAEIVFQPFAPFICEKFADYPALGRFAARDMGQTVAVGVITEVKTK
ncbi:MAG: elongation factor 1-alpha [Candidatus Heimdallarchaeota archaeon]|nr:elongation factor 1-alpha [Candidatus Heimdallarchaeota archaeon]